MTHVPLDELHRRPRTHSASLLQVRVHDEKGPHSNDVGHAAPAAQLQIPPGAFAAREPLAHWELA
jgi:hypothetical protein